MDMKQPGDSPLDPGITRRDFMGTTLVGTGAALLGAGCPAAAQDIGAAWTGPGGVGNYRSSNGNTADVVRAAHRIRDGAYAERLANVIDTGERHDLVVVGGGFGGLGAMLEFRRRFPGGTCLLLDNQEVFGGYAKANEFDVDGYRIAGAQASMNFVLPDTDAARANAWWAELGLPDRFDWVARQGGDPAIKVQRSTSASLYYGEQAATVGYHAGGGRWVTDIWADDLARAPISDAAKRGLLALRDLKRRGPPDSAEAKRLDGMTFEAFAKERSLDPAVLPWVTLGMCQTGPQLSALAALSLPGIDRYAPGSDKAALADRFIAFPGGNAVLARHFVKAMIPDAIAGPATTEAIAAGAINAAALGRGPFRLRARATVVRVEHEGDPATAGGVSVVYEKGGRLYRVRAKTVVMTTGQWVTKHIVAGLPDAQRAALDQFLFAPMLIANVALRNWRFLDRLGFSAARWTEGFGFYASIRQPMALGPNPAPFAPDKPIVMTFYVPFPNPDLPLEAQGPAGRAQLYGTGYAEYEAQLVAQMRTLFASGGFGAKRDIAGIVLNRWGHAFQTAGPGFSYGLDGAPAPRDAARARFGRIAFGQGADWLGTAHNGAWAVAELAAVL